MIPADGKLHVCLHRYATNDVAYATLEQRPDPRTPMIDAVAVVAHIPGPDPERYARLFAAAEDLYKALAIILTHADDPDDDGEHWEEDRARAIAAITKAVSSPVTPPPSQSTGPGAGGSR